MKSRLLWGVATVVLLSAVFSLLHTGHQGSSAELFAQAADNSPNAALHPVTTFTVNSDAPTITAAFAQANQPYYPEDQVSAFPDPTLHIGSVITVRRALPVTVIDGKKTAVVRTWQGTVGDLLSEKKIDLGNDDKISPAPSTPLSADTKIVITRVAITTISINQPISFSITNQNDPNMDEGQTKVTQQGSDGVKTFTYLVRREDGVEISRTLTKTEVTTAPITQIVHVGTRPVITVACGSASDIRGWILSAALQYGLSANKLCTMMMQESGGDRNRISSTTPPYFGLFQYGYFAGAAANLPKYAGRPWNDAEAQVYVTAWEITHGKCHNMWPNTCQF